ncbi:hypothetical protein F1B92_07295 [Campylobacter sp. FMV-PI01]|uniref:Uncharacterized protein n=1 Tax=Campylobacter portucalensis TaxID=2608384 RepID=A0A6L5WMA9_9BACT|nr:hypothetical protein [Campylobacter portucalensis]MSN96963.1 hypothetical protein [Campylobacter portucalensis]
MSRIIIFILSCTISFASQTCNDDKILDEIFGKTCQIKPNFKQKSSSKDINKTNKNHKND